MILLRPNHIILGKVAQQDPTELETSSISKHLNLLGKSGRTGMRCALERLFNEITTIDPRQTDENSTLSRS